MAPPLPMQALKWADLTPSVATPPQALSADISSAPCELHCALCVAGPCQGTQSRNAGLLSSCQRFRMLRFTRVSGGYAYQPVRFSNNLQPGIKLENQKARHLNYTAIPHFTVLRFIVFFCKLKICGCPASSKAYGCHFPNRLR